MVRIAATDLCENSVAVERACLRTGAALEMVRHTSRCCEAALAEGTGYVRTAMDVAVHVLYMLGTIALVRASTFAYLTHVALAFKAFVT